MFLLFIRKVISGKEEYEYARLYMTVQLKGALYSRKSLRRPPVPTPFYGHRKFVFFKDTYNGKLSRFKINNPVLQKVPTLVDK